MPRLLPLCDGNDIPQLCLRAFRTESVAQTKQIVKEFYAAGVRHFELAELFGNAHIVCEALREVDALGDGSRGSLFVTLKLWPKSRKPEDLISCCTTLLQEVGLSYVDLLMIHAPIDLENRADQWKAIEDLKDAGMCKSIGVVNVSSAGLTDVLKNCRITPVVYEMEVTPFNQRQELAEFCSDSSMVVINNEPVAKGLRHKSPELQRISVQCECTVDNLLLRYAAQKGFVVGIPEHCCAQLQGDAEAMLLGADRFNGRSLPDWAMLQLDALEEAEGTAQLSWTPIEPPNDE